MWKESEAQTNALKSVREEARKAKITKGKSVREVNEDIFHIYIKDEQGNYNAPKTITTDSAKLVKLENQKRSGQNYYCTTEQGSFYDVSNTVIPKVVSGFGAKKQGILLCILFALHDAVVRKLTKQQKGTPTFKITFHISGVALLDTMAVSASVYFFRGDVKSVEEIFTDLKNYCIEIIEIFELKEDPIWNLDDWNSIDTFFLIYNKIKKKIGTAHHGYVAATSDKDTRKLAGVAGLFAVQYLSNREWIQKIDAKRVKAKPKKNPTFFETDVVPATLQKIVEKDTMIFHGYSQGQLLKAQEFLDLEIPALGVMESELKKYVSEVLYQGPALIGGADGDEKKDEEKKDEEKKDEEKKEGEIGEKVVEVERKVPATLKEKKEEMKKKLTAAKEEAEKEKAEKEELRLKEKAEEERKIKEAEDEKKRLEDEKKKKEDEEKAEKERLIKEAEDEKKKKEDEERAEKERKIKEAEDEKKRLEDEKKKKEEEEKAKKTNKMGHFSCLNFVSSFKVDARTLEGRTWIIKTKKMPGFVCFDGRVFYFRRFEQDLLTIFSDKSGKTQAWLFQVAMIIKSFAEKNMFIEDLSLDDFCYAAIGDGDKTVPLAFFQSFDKIVDLDFKQFSRIEQTILLQDDKRFTTQTDVDMRENLNAKSTSRSFIENSTKFRRIMRSYNGFLNNFTFLEGFQTPGVSGEMFVMNTLSEIVTSMDSIVTDMKLQPAQLKDEKVRIMIPFVMDRRLFDAFDPVAQQFIIDQKSSNLQHAFSLEKSPDDVKILVGKCQLLLRKNILKLCNAESVVVTSPEKLKKFYPKVEAVTRRLKTIERHHGLQLGREFGPGDYVVSCLQTKFPPITQIGHYENVVDRVFENSIRTPCVANQTSENEIQKKKRAIYSKRDDEVKRREMRKISRGKNVVQDGIADVQNSMQNIKYVKQNPTTGMSAIDSDQVKSNDAWNAISSINFANSQMTTQAFSSQFLF